MKKTGYHEIAGAIHCLSGVRIGGSDDLLQIGGTDLTCIKHPVTLKPYLPGSSLKGKLRSCLEAKLGQFGGRDSNEPCSCGRCIICRCFGPHKNTRHDLGPTRIVVRDAQLVTGGELELKAENVIDRRTGTALHPRKIERVVAGSEFRLRIGLHVWDIDASNCEYGDFKGGEALVELVKGGLREIERSGLGSGVSKGSGEVEFRDLKLDGNPFNLDNR